MEDHSGSETPLMGTKQQNVQQSGEVNNEAISDHPQTKDEMKENKANQQQRNVFKIEYKAYHKPNETSKKEDLNKHKKYKEVKIGEDKCANMKNEADQSDRLKSELKETVKKGYL